MPASCLDYFPLTVGVLVASHLVVFAIGAYAQGLLHRLRLDTLQEGMTCLVRAVGHLHDNSKAVLSFFTEMKRTLVQQNTKGFPRVIVCEFTDSKGKVCLIGTRRDASIPWYECLSVHEGTAEAFAAYDASLTADPNGREKRGKAHGT